MNSNEADLKNAAFIFEWTEALKVLINEMQFELTDIRHDFFKLLYDVSYKYYIGYISYDISRYINEGQIIFTQKILPYKIHLERLIEISQLDILRKSHFNALNRNLHIESWAVFELCTTTLCDALCNEEKRKKLLAFNTKEIKKLFQDGKIASEAFEILHSKLMVNHLTHVPMPRKTDFLFSKAKNYYRNAKKDKEFLIFYAKLRNTMHTNFIYHGKDYEYKFGDAHFIFSDGKIVKWHDPFEPSPKLYFYLVGELKEIWKTLVLSIDHSDFIEYPDSDQE